MDDVTGVDTLTAVDGDSAIPTADTVDSATTHDTDVKPDAATADSATATPDKEPPSKLLRELISNRKQKQELARKVQEQEALIEQLENQGQIKRGSVMPSPENFQTQEEYINALTDWKVAEQAEVIRQEFLQREVETARSAATEKYVERAYAASERYPDFIETTEAAFEFIGASHISDAILASEKGPDIAYHLGKNPILLDKLTRMAPVAAIMEIGRLEAKISAPSNDKTKTPKAPAPITTVSPSGAMSDDDNLSGEDWIRKRNAAEFGKG